MEQSLSSSAFRRSSVKEKRRKRNRYELNRTGLFPNKPERDLSGTRDQTSPSCTGYEVFYSFIAEWGVGEVVVFSIQLQRN